VGFRVVDVLARAHGLAFSRRKKARAYVAEGRIGACPVVLAKPQTYMNRSGRAVGRLMRDFGLSPERLLVVYDDLDLPLGRLRLRAEGGSGGHKGMRSIQEVIGTQAYPRLRVGIDRPPDRIDPADYVLAPFAGDEEPLLMVVLARAAAAVECWLAEGVVAAMDEFNRPFLPEEGNDLA
jgi:PTH1 family peptidyl-tRNA hydrolase